MENKNNYPGSSSAFDLLFVIFSCIQIAGLYIDAWAHAHLDRIDSFFTPWHAIFYGGFILSAALLILKLWQNHKLDYRLPLNFWLLDFGFFNFVPVKFL